ncbi:MAG: hypothetical protein QOI41_7365, partial [Myxococcales bacterium]|nr:hypothetical protein [Myxococcales bacterium]
MAKRTVTAALAFVAAMALATLFTVRAEAHAIGLSTGEYAAKGESVTAKLAFARGEVASVLPNLDENRDGHVTAFEVESAKKDLETRVLGRVHVTRGGAACAAVLIGAELTEQDGIVIDGRFDCGKSGKSEKSATNEKSAFDVDLVLL